MLQTSFKVVLAARPSRMRSAPSVFSARRSAAIANSTPMPGSLSSSADLKNLGTLKQRFDARAFHSNPAFRPRRRSSLTYSRAKSSLTWSLIGGGFSDNCANEQLDASALDAFLHQLAYLVLAFTPSAWKIELQLEKTLIERADLRLLPAHRCAFDSARPKPGHTAHAKRTYLLLTSCQRPARASQ